MMLACMERIWYGTLDIEFLSRSGTCNNLHLCQRCYSHIHCIIESFYIVGNSAGTLSRYMLVDGVTV